jgi:cysteinyl-tRNA synthetase
LYDRRSERRQSGRQQRQQQASSSYAAGYVRASDDVCQLEEGALLEITTMVRERLSAKLQRDFERADELLAQLMAKGVAISDERRCWRVDGGRFDVLSYHEEGNPGGETPGWIGKAIAARGEARKGRDFTRADAILAALEAEGIGVDDASRTWCYLAAPVDGYEAVPEKDSLAALMEEEEEEGEYEEEEEEEGEWGAAVEADEAAGGR